MPSTWFSYRKVQERNRASQVSWTDVGNGMAFVGLAPSVYGMVPRAPIHQGKARTFANENINYELSDSSRLGMGTLPKPPGQMNPSSFYDPSVTGVDWANPKQMLFPPAAGINDYAEEDSYDSE